MCETCSHLRSKSNPPPANFLIVGCGLHRKSFGSLADLKNQKKCKDYKQRGI